MVAKEIKRTGMISCSECDGECCKRMAIAIDKPVTSVDYEDIKWYVFHKNVWVYIDFSDDWYVQFNSPCINLVDGQCTIYDERPPLCKDFPISECEVNTPEMKFCFKNIKDYEKWLSEKK